MFDISGKESGFENNEELKHIIGFLKFHLLIYILNL